MICPTFVSSRFRGHRVLVIGDVMLDCFVYGQVSRISPEAPIPVLSSRSTKSMAGGAANVAVNLSSLGLEAVLIGVAGNDAHGQSLRFLLERGPFPVTCTIVETEDRPTTVKTRFVAGAQQMLRVDQESAVSVPTAVEDSLLEAVSRHIGEVRVVALSDYGKGVLTDRVIKETIKIAKIHGIPVIVDPKRQDFSIYCGATFIKPNLAELQKATGIVCDREGRVEDAVTRVVEATGARVLLTRSEQGMSLFEPDAAPFHVRSVVREVYDVSGAGDTALATFAGAIASDYGPRDAVKLANVASGIAIAKLGTAVVTAEELELALAGTLLHEPSDDRLMSADDAAAQCTRWRLRGLTVGFTNGCFDIVHAGHISLLSAAAAECDRLIVGLNSDASVARLKGPSRPVQGEVSRAQVLGSLDPVDGVVIFDADTPTDLIQRLKPDVLVKGADYTEETVIGGAFVKSYGGRIFLAPLVSGQSTTNAINRMVAGTGSATSPRPRRTGMT